MKKKLSTHEEVLRTLLECASELVKTNSATFFNLNKRKDDFPLIESFGKLQVKQYDLALKLMTVAMGGVVKNTTSQKVGAKEFIFQKSKIEGIYFDLEKEIVGIVGLQVDIAEAVLVIYKTYTANQEEIIFADDLFDFLENNQKHFAPNNFIKPLFDQFSKNFFSEKIKEKLVDIGDRYFDSATQNIDTFACQNQA